jgi:hypothetical protein
VALYPKVLSSRQHKIISHLGPILATRRIYLAGGTAIAIQLGHRRSVDLDWFSQQKLGAPLPLPQQLQNQSFPLQVISVDEGTVYARLWGVQLTLLEYRYPLLKPLVSWPDAKIKLASLPDLAAMKLLAIAQRGSKKDFVDIYALTRSGLSLHQMLRWYQKKYSVSDIGHLLYSLAYFDDADGERMPAMIWKVRWADIKNSLRQWIRAS